MELVPLNGCQSKRKFEKTRHIKKKLISLKSMFYEEKDM